MPTFQTTSFIQSQQATLGETVPVGHRQFYIPLNQRPFVWTRQQVAGLWSDFERQILSHYVQQHSQGAWYEKPVMDAMPHFLGNFIFVRREGVNGQQLDEVEVFDGQQRLTAISMLASCLLDHAELLVQSGGGPQTSLVYADLMKWIYADPNSRALTPRIVPDQAFMSLFNCLIVNNRTLPARQLAVQQLAIDFKSNPDHKTFLDRFMELYLLVSSRVGSLSSAERPLYLAAAVDVLSRFFLCIQTMVPVESFGLRVFTSLNTAATPLSAVDNLKNEFFVRVSKQHHLNVSSNWRSIIGALGSISPKDFFRRRLLSLGHQCSNDDKDLFRRIVELELNGKTDSQLLTHLSLLSGEAVVLKKIRSATGFGASTCRSLKDIYEVLGASIADIVLLAAHRKFMPVSTADFDESARLVRNFLFRELTIGQRDTAALEKNLVTIADSVKSGGINALKVSLQHVSKDASFVHNFAERIEERPKIQFFILFCIEEYLSRAQGLQPYPHSPSQHIEHIVPKNYKKMLPSGAPAWPFWNRRQSAFHGRYVNRLGNLLLLEANINTSVKNRSFEEKKSGLHQLTRGVKRKLGYKDSGLRMPTKISKAAITELDAGQIERRQRALAKLALKVWRLI